MEGIDLAYSAVIAKTFRCLLLWSSLCVSLGNAMITPLQSTYNLSFSSCICYVIFPAPLQRIPIAARPTTTLIKALAKSFHCNTIAICKGNHSAFLLCLSASPTPPLLARGTCARRTLWAVPLVVNSEHPSECLAKVTTVMANARRIPWGKTTGSYP